MPRVIRTTTHRRTQAAGAALAAVLGVALAAGVLYGDRLGALLKTFGG